MRRTKLYTVRSQFTYLRFDEILFLVYLREYTSLHLQVTGSLPIPVTHKALSMKVAKGLQAFVH